MRFIISLVFGVVTAATASESRADCQSQWNALLGEAQVVSQSTSDFGNERRTKLIAALSDALTTCESDGSASAAEITTTIHYVTAAAQAVRDDGIILAVKELVLSFEKQKTKILPAFQKARRTLLSRIANRLLSNDTRTNRRLWIDLFPFLAHANPPIGAAAAQERLWSIAGGTGSSEAKKLAGKAVRLLAQTYGKDSQEQKSLMRMADAAESNSEKRYGIIVSETPKDVKQWHSLESVPLSLKSPDGKIVRYLIPVVYETTATIRVETSSGCNRTYVVPHWISTELKSTDDDCPLRLSVVGGGKVVVEDKKQKVEITADTPKVIFRPKGFVVTLEAEPGDNFWFAGYDKIPHDVHGVGQIAVNSDTSVVAYFEGRSHTDTWTVEAPEPIGEEILATYVGSWSPLSVWISTRSGRILHASQDAAATARHGYRWSVEYRDPKTRPIYVLTGVGRPTVFGGEDYWGRFDSGKWAASPTNVPSVKFVAGTTTGTAAFLISPNCRAFKILPTGPPSSIALGCPQNATISSAYSPGVGEKVFVAGTGVLGSFDGAANDDPRPISLATAPWGTSNWASISGSSITDVRTVGTDNQVAQYNGTSWYAADGEWASARAISVKARSNAWAVGGDNSLYRWEDAGWQAITKFATSIQSVLTGDLGNVLVSGSDGTLAYYAPTGWRYLSGFGDRVSNIVASDDGSAWAWSPSGAIARRDSDGVWRRVGCTGHAPDSRADGTTFVSSGAHGYIVNSTTITRISDSAEGILCSKETELPSGVEVSQWALFENSAGLFLAGKEVWRSKKNVWTSEKLPTGETIQEAFGNQTEVLALSTNGTLLQRRIVGGNVTWTREALPPSVTMLSRAVLDSAGQITAVASDGKTYVRALKGTAWSATVFGPEVIRGIHITANHLLLPADGGVLLVKDLKTGIVSRQVTAPDATLVDAVMIGNRPVAVAKDGRVFRFK